MAAFTVAALSMIGLPPTAGFFSKWYLALAAIDSGRWLFLAIILISSLLNAVYFFRILERVYLITPPTRGMDDPSSKAKNKRSFILGEEEYSLMLPALILSFSLLLLGLGNVIIVKDIIQRIIPSGM